MHLTNEENKKRQTEGNEVPNIVVARGDGIGPEIMDSTLRILEAAGANINTHFVEIGEKEYLNGNTSGISESAWEAIRENKVLLKAPITTPQGKGYKSLNVTIRKSLGLFANVRPCKSLYPHIRTKHPFLDIVVVRENEEDLYAGIEHRQTEDVYQCLKLITRPGTEKIIRHAFEYARMYQRKKVTCLVKDNIMKLTDGLFHRVFLEIGAEYPEIEQQVQIIDIGAARVANVPENYDVIVTTNLYGDIISDIVAEMTGSVGIAGSSNVGEHGAMFEAIHGSAPDIAGQGIANPSGLLNAACMMLVHLGQNEIAEKINNAWLKTIEDGVHTGDIFNPDFSKKKVGTETFTNAVIERLGQQPVSLTPTKLNAASEDQKRIKNQLYKRKESKKQLVGVDVFVDWKGDDPEIIGQALEQVTNSELKLKMITNRGVKVYPDGIPETFCTDHWRCRFIDKKINGYDEIENVSIDYKSVIELQTSIQSAGLESIKTENLYTFDGVLGYSLGQGE